MKYYHWLIVIAIMGVVLIFGLPAYQRMHAETALYHDALSLHPRGYIRNGQRPFLFLTWFLSRKSVQTCSVYKNGWEYVIRNRGTQGGGGIINQTPEFKQLQVLPPLPEGLPGPGAVPHSRLLIVTHLENGKMITRYYDREELPGEIGDVLALLGTESVDVEKR